MTMQNKIIAKNTIRDNNTFIRHVLNYIHEREKNIYMYLFVHNKAWS